MKFASAMYSQLSLFEPLLELPKEFRYHADVLDEEEEHTLIGEINRLPFKEFEFHGFSSKRRVVSFGWQYDFKHAKLREAASIPAFLLPVREKGYRRGAKPLIRSRLGSDDSRIWPVAVHNLDLGPPRDHCNYIYEAAHGLAARLLGDDTAWRFITLLSIDLAISAVPKNQARVVVG